MNILCLEKVNKIKLNLKMFSFCKYILFRKQAYIDMR